MPKKMLCSIVIIVIFSSINSGCFDLPTFFEYHYHAYYEKSLNLSAIETEMNNHSIDTSTYYPATLYCTYGISFNNISVADSHCKMGNVGLNHYVHIRLYGAHEERRDDLEKHKPSIIQSMEYLISIIYNATGENPYQFDLEIQGTASLQLPETNQTNPNQ